MEFSTLIPLMVAAIQSSGQVLSSFVSKAKQTASNYIIDKTFVENTVANSAEQLEELFHIKSSDLKKEIREQSIRDVVEELQAHITSIGKLLSFVKTSEITPEMAERLITGGLLPLQVSLEKAELRLKRFGKNDLRLYCHIVGTNTLIAGYVFAGQTVPSLQKDLQESVYDFQKRLLDSLAKTSEIPWDKVPHLLTIEGVSELFELYNSTLRDNEKKIVSKGSPSPAKKPKVEVVEPPAMKLNSFFSNVLYCSECGYKGIERDTEFCPKCHRKFARYV